MFRFGPPKYSVGIDIGSSSLKFVMMKKTKQGPTIVAHGLEKYPEGTFVDGALQNPATISSMIKTMRKEHALKMEQVFTAIPSYSTILRFLPLPEMGDDELAMAINAEAEQYVPYPIDTVNIHFAKLDRIEQDGMTRILCLLAVCQKEFVHGIVDIFRGCGIKTLDALDIDSLAVINALRNYLVRDPSFEAKEGIEGETPAQSVGRGVNADEVVAIVSIGAKSTIINVLKGNVLRFSRNVQVFSGNNITEVIRSVFKCSFQEAEDIKIDKSIKAHEGQEDQEFSEVVRTTVEEIAGEIRRSFDYYKAQHREPVIHRVILTGGSAKLKDIDILLTNELGVEVEKGDPSFGLLRDMENEEVFEEHKDEYSVAIGLALRGCLDED